MEDALTVATGGHGGEEDRKCSAEVVDHHLAKPIDVGALVEYVSS